MSTLRLLDCCLMMRFLGLETLPPAGRGEREEEGYDEGRLRRTGEAGDGGAAAAAGTGTWGVMTGRPLN